MTALPYYLSAPTVFVESIVSRSGGATIDWLESSSKLASHEYVVFAIVMAIVAVVWVVGGVWMIRYPEQILAMNKKYVPKGSWALLTRLGLIKPALVRVVGCIAIPVGILLLVTLLAIYRGCTF